MNDGPKKLHAGYLVEGLELFIPKVAYTKYDATVLVRWSNYSYRRRPVPGPPHFNTEDGSSICLRKVCIRLCNYVVLQHRNPQS
jgi:hypothetical protein